MIQRGKNNTMSDQRAIINKDTSLILKLTICVNEDVVSDGDILSEIRIERRKQSERLSHRFSNQFGKQFGHLIRLMILCVDFHCNLLSLAAVVSHQLNHPRIFTQCISVVKMLQQFLQFHHFISCNCSAKAIR